MQSHDKIDECTTYNRMVEKQRQDGLICLDLVACLEDTLSYLSTFNSADTSYDHYMCLIHLFDAYTCVDDRDAALRTLEKIETIAVDDEDALYSEIASRLLQLGVYEKAIAYAERHVKYISERFGGDHSRGPLLMIDAQSLLLWVLCERDPFHPEVQVVLSRITATAAYRYNYVDSLLNCFKILFPLHRVPWSALPAVEYLMYGLMSLKLGRSNTVEEQLRLLEGWVAELVAARPQLGCGG